MPLGWGILGPRRQVDAHPLRQRLLRHLRRLSGAVMIKSHEVHFVRVRGQVLKRIRFEDTAQAAAVEAALIAVGPCDALPVVMGRDKAELWLEYVRGDSLDRRSLHRHAQLVTFFAELHRRGSRLVPVEETPYPSGLERDIRFLVDARVVDAARAARLAELARELRPEKVWVGFDYVDPLPKNFVVRRGHLVGVDVEALRVDGLLGYGMAKAMLRWFDLGAEPFAAAIAAAGAPDLRSQFDYADLCFRCEYARQKRFQRKEHLAPPSIFDRFVR